eukprot:PhM_4_TR6707/c0_g1_i1/m.79122/K00326/E1.6.2.2; cytochrome-b5 reductase
MRTFFAVSAATSGAFVFFNLFRHRAVRAEAVAGPSSWHSTHTFPSQDPYPYTSLGTYEEQPNETRLIRFALPRASDPVALDGVSTVRVEVDADKPARHYFPMYNDDKRGHFDILVWNRDAEEALFKQHIIGDDVRVRAGDTVLDYRPGLYSNVVLMIDPSGVPPTFQLLHEIKHRDPTAPLPNVEVLYFKPRGWGIGTPLDGRLETQVAELSDLDEENPSRVKYVTHDTTSAVASTLRTLPMNDTLVVTMCSDAVLRSVKREVAGFLDHQYHRRQPSTPTTTTDANMTNRFLFVRTK